MKKMNLVFTTLAFAFLMSGFASATDWQVIYQTDFSSDPGWTTDDSAKLNWDSITETFHGIQVNMEGTYAVKQIAGLDLSKAWRLEFDSTINSNQWSAGLTIGLFDSQLQFPYGNILDFGASDNGQCVQLRSGLDSMAWTNSPAWATGTWYHSVMEYDPVMQQITATILNRSTGEFFMSLTTGGILFSGDASYVGVSRLHMKGNPPGASGEATVDYNIDNIVIEQIPEPATLLLITLGGLFLRKRKA